MSFSNIMRVRISPSLNGLIRESLSTNDEANPQCLRLLTWSALEQDKFHIVITDNWK